MCGINGIINFKSKPNLHDIKIMNQLLTHRGPDGSGEYLFKNALLGHTRLSIQDLSSKGMQPMSNDNRYWLVFNGEIYNFKELRKELECLNHIFYSDTDTEVILNSFKEWGVESFQKFNGMWSFALLDTIEEELIICRDRYGVKPCYIYEDNAQFIFSSEIKPIKKITSDSLDQNKILLEEHQKEGLFITDYKNINILEPGHYIKINLANNKIEKKRWWYGLNHLCKISPNREQIIEEYKEKLKKAVKLRLIADVKISTSLSGGIDSSIIFSELNLLGVGNLNLNPFILNYPENETFKFAVNFAKSLGKKPFIINETNDNLNIDTILETFKSLERKQFYLKQLELYSAQKKNGFKVSIDGHGADESLGGYVDNIKDFSIGLQNDLVDTYVTIHHISSSNLNNILAKNNLTPINKHINANLTHYLKSDYKTSFVEKDCNFELTDSCINDLNDLKNFEFGFQSLYMKSNYGFLQWLLNKWDRASMSKSIEIRSPFLDWELFQYSISIPIRHKSYQGKNKSLLRDAYRDQVSDEILNYKSKQGLPIENNQNYKKLIINNSVNEKKFKESGLWDFNKISQYINKNEFDESMNKELIKICETYLMNESFSSSTIEDEINAHNSSLKNNLLGHPLN